MPDLLDLVPIDARLTLPLVVIAITALAMTLRFTLGKTARMTAAPASIALLRRCRVTVRPLMGREQAAVHAALAGWTAEKGLLLSCEVSLSAIFRVTQSDAAAARAGFATIRQKYLDFLVTDRMQVPICGVEHHGSGHWSRDAVARDAVKAEAFALSGLPSSSSRRARPRSSCESGSMRSCP